MNKIKSQIRGLRQRVAETLADRSTSQEDEYLYADGPSASQGSLTADDETRVEHTLAVAVAIAS